MPDVTTQRWLLFGPGAIGGVIAHQLLQQQQEIAFLPHRASQHSSMNWRLQQHGQWYVHQTPIYQQQWQPDAVIVAVKSYQLEAALARLDSLKIAPDCPILVSHNGFVASNSVRPLFPLITTQAAHREGRNIVHSASGQSWLAKLSSVGAEEQRSPLPTVLIEILSAALEPLTVSTDIDNYRWQKLLINCVINPLTAYGDCANGDLLQPHWRPQILALIDEFVQIAQASAIAIEHQQAEEIVYRVIRQTQSNTSSMLADVRRHQPTEIDALNGFLLRQAERLGIAAPTHQALTDRVRRLSSY